MQLPWRWSDCHRRSLHLAHRPGPHESCLERGHAGHRFSLLPRSQGGSMSVPGSRRCAAKPAPLVAGPRYPFARRTPCPAPASPWQSKRAWPVSCPPPRPPRICPCPAWPLPVSHSGLCGSGSTLAPRLPIHSPCLCGGRAPGQARPRGSRRSRGGPAWPIRCCCHPQVWDFEHSVDQYNCIGGTGRQGVNGQIEDINRWLRET